MDAAYADATDGLDSCKELEMVIFDAGGFIFGTEVSQIISIVRSTVPVRRELGSPSTRKRRSQRTKSPDTRELGSTQQEHLSSVLAGADAPGDVTGGESIPVADLSGLLVTGGTLLSVEAGAPAETSHEGASPLSKPRDSEAAVSGNTMLLVDIAYAPGSAEMNKAGAIGVYIDSVRDVVRMSLGQIEPFPEFLSSRMEAFVADCIWGIGRLGEELVVLLDLGKYLSVTSLAEGGGRPFQNPGL